MGSDKTDKKHFYLQIIITYLQPTANIIPKHILTYTSAVNTINVS